MLNRGKFKVVFGVLAIVFAVVLVFFSCVPVTPPAASKEVVIQTSRHGHITNAHLVYARDGLTGTWTKLTGTNGIYKFNVNDPNGIYSVAVAEPKVGYSEKRVYLFNAKLNETNFIPLDVGNPTDEDAATLTINVPTQYSGKQLSVFFSHEHRFPEVEDGKAVAFGLPKAKGDLVIFVGSPWSDEGFEKIAIKRDFVLDSDRSLSITESDLKDIELAPAFTDISMNWLIGGNCYVFGGYKIPTSLKSDKDLYVFNYTDYSVKRFSYSEYRKDFPTTTPFATSSINPANYPTTPFSTSTTSNSVKVTVTPYSPGISGIDTILYSFILYSYTGVNEWGWPIRDVTYVVYLSSGYLAALTNNEYTLPVIGGDFASFDIDLAKSIALDESFYFPNYIASNKTLKDYLIPVDGLKVLEKFRE
ncbi:hypothetical protein NA23_07790 [Fervidobacterium islandicum]|uniref:Uncharacterized protein n=1 Tax=Fervidobacterium islandicum TaxID=2423 RepID=A0AAI8CMF2_FERIS|nr:hypothetical protein [Fervidobacterium islandicum]AMW33153.1 hypothetical protein NA23_07790 [Fervidobacterium islandicum]